MKKYIGKKVEFVAEGFPRPFTATVVNDYPNRIAVRGSDDEERVRFIIKSKICSFMALEPVEEDDVTLTVLACENPSIKCPGVQYVKDGEGFSRADLEVFMGPCPKRCDSCRAGSRGNLRAADGELLQKMMSGTLYGDYPQGDTE